MAFLLPEVLEDKLMCQAERIANDLLPYAQSDNDMAALLEYANTGFADGPVCRMAQEAPWKIRDAFNRQQSTRQTN